MGVKLIDTLNDLGRSTPIQEEFTDFQEIINDFKKVYEVTTKYYEEILVKIVKELE